jgi:hypothetical protein
MLSVPLCFGWLLAFFPAVRWLIALCRFFGPSLLPPFDGPLYYYGLC